MGDDVAKQICKWGFKNAINTAAQKPGTQCDFKISPNDLCQYEICGCGMNDCFDKIGKGIAGKGYCKTLTFK